MTMSLSQMLEALDDVLEKAPVPTEAALLHSGCPVVDEMVMDDVLIKVYQNGYVFQREGKYATVFPLQICKDYVQTDVTGERHVIPYEAFADSAWYIRAMLEGNDRISHNRTCRDEHAGLISHDGFADGSVCLSDRWAGDPLTIMVEKSVRQEEYSMLHKAMDETLTKKQKHALEECVGKGRMQAEVAMEMGISRNAVSGTVERGLGRMRKYYGTEGQAFGRNHFYSPESRKDGN